MKNHLRRYLLAFGKAGTVFLCLCHCSSAHNRQVEIARCTAPTTAKETADSLERRLIPKDAKSPIEPLRRAASAPLQFTGVIIMTQLPIGASA